MAKTKSIKKFFIKSLSCLLMAVFMSLFVSEANACNDNYKCTPSCKYTKVETCTLCPVFVVVFNTVSKIGDLSAKNFSGAIMSVVVVFFAVWLAMEVIKFVSSMKSVDLKDFSQTLINRGFVIILVLIILKTGVGSFYNVFIQPVYNTGQNMAQIMFEDGNSQASDQSDKKALKDPSISKLQEFKDGLPVSMGASIIKTMTMMENRIRKINALGFSMLCQSWKEAIWYFIPRPKYVIFGFITILITTSLIIMIPFLLIDAVFQLGVATVLMPFAVGSYAFEYTRKAYCKKIFDIFLNSTFTFLFLSVVVLVLLGAIQTSVKSGYDFEEMFASGSTGYNAFTGFKNSVTWGSGFLLNLLFLILLAWSVMDMGKKFASDFAKSVSSTNIGSKLGGAVGSAALGAAKKATAADRAFLSKSVRGIGQRLGRAAVHATSRAKTSIQQRRFNKNKATTDSDGNRKYTKKGKIYEMDKNGNVTKTKNESKITRSGKKVETETKEIRTKNGVLKIITKTVKTKNDAGEWIVESVNVSERLKFASEEASKIMGKDGRFNAAAMEKLLEGTSGETRELLRNNAIRQITESRFSKAAFDPSKEKLAKPAETYVDKKTGEIVTKYTTASGEIIFSKTKLRQDGLVESKLVRIENDEKQKKDQAQIDKRNEGRQKEIDKKNKKIQKIKDGKNDEDLSWFQKRRIKKLNKKIEKLNLAKEEPRPRRVTTFESDGIRNKMTVNLLNENVNLSEMEGVDAGFVSAEQVLAESELKAKEKEIENTAKEKEELEKEKEKDEKEKEELDKKIKELEEKIKENEEKEKEELEKEKEKAEKEKEELEKKIKETGEKISETDKKTEDAEAEKELIKDKIEKAKRDAKAKGLSIDDVEHNLRCDKDGNIIERSGYSYTEHYKRQLDSGTVRERDIPDGMFGKKEIQRDKHGNIVDGEFKRYRHGVANDDTIRWSDFNFRRWGNSEENRNARVLYEGKIFKGGNDYDAMEADMNFYFTNSSSPKRTKRIFKNIRGF